MIRSARSQFARLAAPLAGGPLAALLRRACRGRDDTLHVLMYHRVDWPAARPDLCPSTLSATPTGFADQMACLWEHFHAVSLDDVAAAFRGERHLPARSVLITFDDAYRDFREHAWPVLKRLDLPAVLFVPTALASGRQPGFWWDRLHRVAMQAPLEALRNTKFGDLPASAAVDRRRASRALAARFAALPHAEALQELDRLSESHCVAAAPVEVLDWDELTALAAEGLTLAPHTATHPLLDRIALEQARREIVDAREALRQRIGSCCRAFAFPGGAYTQAHLAMLREEGFELAFTTRRGANHLRRSDPLQLRRINVGLRATAHLLQAQLLLPPGVFNRLAR